MLRCCYYDVSELAQRELFDRGLEELAWSERCEKVMRFHFDKDKRLCLGAGLLAADMLKNAGADDLSLSYSRFGKPFLVNHSDIHFNLSHDGQLAVCAVSDGSVGVDVQQQAKYDAGVAKRVFSSDELAVIESADDRDDSFSRLWARKESCIKMLGVGFMKDARELSTVKGDGEFFFTEFEPKNYYICVCSEKRQQAVFSSWVFSQR